MNLENKESKELAKTIKKAEDNSVEIWCAKTLQHHPHQDF